MRRKDSAINVAMPPGVSAVAHDALSDRAIYALA
jgi:hypothetical protein